MPGISGLALTVLVTDSVGVPGEVIVPVLLPAFVSPVALVVIVALIGALVVGVPEIVHTIDAPAASVCGGAGRQAALNPGGRPATAHVTLAAAAVALFVQETVWPAGYGVPMTVAARTVLAGTLTSGPVTGVGPTEPEHGVATVQAGSPPPLTLAVLVMLVPPMVGLTVIGTVTTMGLVAPAAIEQPVRLADPIAGQPLNVPPVAVGAARKVMPAGSASVRAIAAVVGPLTMLMVTT